MFAATLALLTFTAAPVPKNLPKAPPTPEGEWKMVELVSGGMPGDAKYIGAAVTFKDGKFTVVAGQAIEIFPFTFDAKATPAAMDISYGDDARGLGVKAIYKLENDKLTICFAKVGDRPTKFESPLNSVNDLFVLERVKK